jgi:pyruvate dehydrogenase E2 component (dihydrolipoamide acetyltransferase)
MATEITMPKLSDTMEEGTILHWRVKKGDRISKGDIIAEVETDKAAMEMEAFDDGTVAEIKVGEGETVSVGTVIAVLSIGGEAEAEEEKMKEAEIAQKEKLKEKEAKAPEKAEEKATEEEKEEGREAERIEAEREEKREEEKKEEKAPKEEPEKGEFLFPLGRGLTASPAARKLARERGIDLRHIRGSGPGGRVVTGDVERAAESPAPETKVPAREKEQKREAPKKSVKIRRIVARKMVESWQNIPHFFVTVAVDMTDAIRFRKDLGVSINDFILIATVRSLKEHPWVNSHWVDGEAVEQESINIAIAVATDRGLYNPVIKNCAGLSLKEISRRASDLGKKAHQGKLSQEDLEGGTFTVSNMGMLGVESFSAIITPPQAAVLAVGTVKGEIVLDEHEEPVIAPILRLTLSADHRTLDGADAAEFLATLKSYLEAPVTLVSCKDGKGR